MKKHSSIRARLMAFMLLLMSGVLAYVWAAPMVTTAAMASRPTMGMAPRPGPTTNAYAVQATPGTTRTIPAVVEKLYFGVPAGNGYAPQRVAVDHQRRRLYTLNQGLTELNESLTLSVLDLETEQIIALLNLPQPQTQLTFPPNPLDLQVDPYRPRLYAVWGDPYAEPLAVSLTIIDLEQLTILDTRPGVAAIAPGPDRLYLAGDTRLWAADPFSFAELAGFELELEAGSLALSGITRTPLLLNAPANRLYLAHSQPAVLEVLAADTLAPVNGYPVAGQFMRAVVDEAGERIFVVASDDTQVTLHLLDSEGRPLPQPAPLTLANDTYTNPPLALSGSTLAVVTQTTTSHFLQLLAKTTLAQQASLAIPSYPNDLAADPATGHFYALYSSPNSFILALDPATGAAETIYTALTLRAALADPATNRLYLLNNEGTLQLLDLADYTEIDRLETEPPLNCKDSSGCIFRPYVEPDLALDPTRQRLYVSGNPVRIVDTNTLAVTATLDTPGQLTPDPGSDRLYLTPPCQCRLEQCNTLILDAQTLTGTATLFPPAEPLAAPCVFATTLDAENDLLYARIYNGIPGSNSGDYFSVFEVAGPPRLIYTNGEISFGPIALDPLRQRAFIPRYRLDRSFLYRFEVQGQTLTQTLALAGAGGSPMYDPPTDRLYVVSGSTLQVFDGDLALLAEITLPGQFIPFTFDSQGQRLYLGDSGGNLLVVAAAGGQLETPATAASESVAPPQLLVASPEVRFQIDNQRLYRSLDGGQTWQLLGPGLPDRPLNTLAISPDFALDQTLLAGFAGFGREGGLYRSNDSGETWQPATRGLTDLEIGQIVFSPTFAQDQTIFVTTLYRGLFRSTDGGQSWSTLAATYSDDSDEAPVSDLAVSPAFVEDQLLFIGARDLLRSSDGGQSWTETGLPVGRIAFSPDFVRDGLILNQGRWRSTDRGQNWQPAAAGLEPAMAARSLFFSPNFRADQTVYLLLEREYDLPLILQRSSDAGQTWQTLLSGLPAGFEVAAASVLPTGALYLSDRAGEPLTIAPETLSWGTQPVDLTQLELQDLVVTPDDLIFVANSAAGVFKSTDGGQTWLETGFPARADETQLARLALAHNGALFAAAGQAIERSADSGQSWTYLPNLPAGFTVAALAVSPDFANDRIILAGGDYRSNQLLRSPDGGTTWGVVFDGATIEDAAEISAIAFSPNFATDGTAYAWLQHAGLLRSTDGGQSWSRLPGAPAGYPNQTIAITPQGDRIYLGALYGRLLVSTDQGETWQDLSDHIPADRSWSSALAFGENNTLFLGTDIGVYRSPDGVQTWTPANAGLPAETSPGPARGVRALAFSQGRLYAALAQGGLFVSEDQGQSWRSATASQTQTSPAVTPPPPALPTATPAAPPPATVTPVVCATSPTYFAEVWAARMAQLGCPAAAQRLLMAEQTFEGGQMIWRSDLGVIYVLPLGQPYRRYQDTWDESQPAYSCLDLGPAQTPPTPQRGFGKIWCSEPDLRQALGQAVSAEHPFEATLQEFATGLIFQADGGVIYILEDGSNNWERLE